MIQRKQSLFLLLAVIAYAICLFLPIASVSASGMGADSMIYNLGVVNGDSGISISSTWYVDYLLMVFSIIPVPEVEGAMNYQFAACLPLVALILVLMARKGVSDDEKLVRAADRIR